MGLGSTEVDRYQLHEPIASGGMATVYFARQRGAAGFAKAVAVKRMRPDLLGDRDVATLFLDEARLAARLSPPLEPDFLADYTAGDALLHIALHNAHHLGQITTLRQQLGTWPPPAGSWTW